MKIKLTRKSINTQKNLFKQYKLSTAKKNVFNPHENNFYYIINTVVLSVVTIVQRTLALALGHR